MSLDTFQARGGQGASAVKAEKVSRQTITGHPLWSVPTRTCSVTGQSKRIKKALLATVPMSKCSRLSASSPPMQRPPPRRNHDAFHAQKTRKVRLSRCRVGPAASKSSKSNDSAADRSLPFLDAGRGMRRARCFIWYSSHFSQATSNAFRSLVRANVGIGV